ncbi:saccharopine dehydrogenase family protein [Aeromicrobium sp. 50.2.37]|uniref:saccharopine dehydrogenase family protein n=1 Tax=Aeromicrobium sp. 50.2.37 TaxID=2969305 RepID=UPI00214FC16C|nr:saccharopine dehydrogenase NADP-binding domain-containing protein [Aeromicrobium sp. 50.2.37]MCR4512641.1 saccharopine dehydrogenase NADP-binding domain-containing protein [Aeromicrobium sp. 50.2.37]
MTPEKLRVIVVGGAGSMGRWAVRTIAALGTAEILTVADIDAERAEKTAKAVGGPCQALALDATDEVAMTDAFARHDVVVNTMGPFATFMLPILEAAIDSDCHYLDINDDWQPTIAAFDLDQRARERGLHVVIGLGGSPGVTNLCAAIAAETLDEVHELYTGWKISAATIVDEPDFPAPKASAAMDHWIHQCSEPIRVWEGGEPADVAAVEPVTLDFPGVGPVTAYTMGHPEPITLPRTYPRLSRSLNLQSGPAWLLDGLRDVGRRVGAGSITLREGIAEMGDLPRPATKGPRDALPIEWSLAIGTKDGAPHATAVYPTAFHPARMGGNTGVPVGIGVELLRRGALRDVGVHAPESAVPAREFFDLLAPLTDPSLRTASDLLAIVQR